MIILKTIFYLIKQIARKAKAPALKDVMICTGVISIVGLVCLLLGRKAAS